TLLLHALLDKAAMRAPDAARLAALWEGLRRDAPARSRLEALLHRHCEPALPWEAFATAAEAATWGDLLAWRGPLARRLFRRQPLACVARTLRLVLLRRLRPVLCAVQRRGLSVALVAPDGAGKSTLA